MEDTRRGLFPEVEIWGEEMDSEKGDATPGLVGELIWRRGTAPCLSSTDLMEARHACVYKD